MAGQEGEDAATTPAGDTAQGAAQGAAADSNDETMEHDEQAASSVEEEASADDAPEPTVESLTAALVAAEVEVEEAKDQALRAVAEVENVRRRADRSVENAHKFALERFAADLLPAIDSFDRAAATARELASSDSSVAATAEGIELSLKVLNDALTKHGVQVIEPEGEPFDPQFHEAMSMIENPDVEPGSVLHVVEKGYTLNERLVRAARVIVAKAPAADASDSNET